MDEKERWGGEREKGKRIDGWIGRERERERERARRN